MNIPSWRHEEICGKYWFSFMVAQPSAPSAVYSMDNMMLDIKRERSAQAYTDDFSTMKGLFTAWRERI